MDVDVDENDEMDENAMDDEDDLGDAHDQNQEQDEMHVPDGGDPEDADPEDPSARDPPPKRPGQLAVHRCRFVDFTPSAVTALAFPPLRLPHPSVFRPSSSSQAVLGSTQAGEGVLGGGGSKRKFGVLAVGRANGNVELCEWTGREYEVQSSQGWQLTKLLPAPIPSKVESLAFVLRHSHTHNPHNHDTSEDLDVPSLQALRLFSAGGGSELVEWDLERGCVLRTLPSHGGSIWSLSPNPPSTLLALGCEDGCVRLVDVSHGQFAHTRRMDRGKGRVLSVAWGPVGVSGPPVDPDSGVGSGAGAMTKKRKTNPVQESNSKSDGSDDSDDSDDSEDEEDKYTYVDSYIITGGSDSCLRKWDVQSGRMMQRMLVEKVRGDRTLVWAVCCLRDGTIVSGDSLGGVRFWDGKTGTEMYAFRNHGADVLCIAVAPDGESVFTSGIDQKTCFYTHVRASPPPSSSSSDPEDQNRNRNQDDEDDSDTLGASILFRRKRDKWIFSCEKRMHSHDVRAMAIWPPHILVSPHRHAHVLDRYTYSNIAPVLVSGGLDMNVVLAPCASISMGAGPGISSGGLGLASAQAAVKMVNPLATSAVCTFEDAYHCRMPYSLGVTPAVQMARGRGLMVCRREEGVSIWRMGRGVGVPGLGLDGLSISNGDIKNTTGNDDEDEDGEPKPRKKKPRGKKKLIRAQIEAENAEKRKNEPGYVKVMDVDVEGLATNLVASAISEDGRWMAVADLYETRLFYLREERGRTEYEEVEEFVELMRTCLDNDPTTSSSSSGPSSSSASSALPTGSSAIAFSPDSSKMVLATTFGAAVCVFDLRIYFESAMKVINADGDEEDEEVGEGGQSGQGTISPSVRFLTKFRHHGSKMVRAIRPLPQSSTPGASTTIKSPTSKSKSKPKSAAQVNGKSSGAADSDGSSDEAVSDKEEDEGSDFDDEDENRVEGVKVTKIVFSADGQWCASSDDRRRTYVYNMDSVKYHCAAPVMPNQIAALHFHSPPPNASSKSKRKNFSPAFTPSSIASPLPLPSPASRFSSPASTSALSIATSGFGAGCNILVLGLVDNTFEVFDVEVGRVPEWGRGIKIPERVRKLRDPMIGIVADLASLSMSAPAVSSTFGTIPQSGVTSTPSLPKIITSPTISAAVNGNHAPSPGGIDSETDPSRYVYLWGSSWICQVVLDAPAGWGGFSKKRRREGKKTAKALKRQKRKQLAAGGVIGQEAGKKSRSKLAQSISAGQVDEGHNDDDEQTAVEGSQRPNKTDEQQEQEEVVEEEDESTEMTNFKVVTRYRPILYVGFIAPGEMVVVERPLVDVLAGMPPAYFRPRYGKG